MQRFFVLLMVLFVFLSSCTRCPLLLESPDKNILLSISLTKDRQPAFDLFYNNQNVLLYSTIGFQLDSLDDMIQGFQVIKHKREKIRSQWNTVAGEQSAVPQVYNELSVTFREKKAPQRKMIVVFRAYNEGIAFQTLFPEQNNLTDFIIQDEKTVFRFAENDSAWISQRAQSEYFKMPISEVHKAERPLVIEHQSGFYSALAEAQLVDYARIKLSSVENTSALQTVIHSPVKAKAPFATPWRVVFLAETAAELLEHNYLLQNFNPPCAIENTDWIKPGKVIREVTLTDEGAKACVDFCVENNFQYIEFDAGWYGFEYADSSDATTITIDPKRSAGPLNLQQMIDYAHSKDIGVIVYVNRRALERQLDEILPLYKKWGIDGIKYGFVNVGSQEWTKWVYDAVALAAEYEFMIDVHDEYRPTGTERTWPHFMTMEGIRGDEEMPTTQHDLITAFCRGLAGRGDHTICYFSDRIKARHAAQLAKSVIFFSPWQFLYWYDKPEQIYDAPELEFWKHLPTVWDETQIVDGEIGEFIITARKSADEWFIGTLTNDQPRTVDVNLDFLDDKKYSAEIYFDGDLNDGTRTHVNKFVKEVTKNNTLELNMPAHGGCAVRIIEN